MPASAAVLSRPHRAAQQRNGASPPWGQMDGHPKSHGGALASSGSQEGAAPHPGGPEVHRPVGPQSPHHSVPSPGRCEEQVTRHLLAARCPTGEGHQLTPRQGTAPSMVGICGPARGCCTLFWGDKQQYPLAAAARSQHRYQGDCSCLFLRPPKHSKYFSSGAGNKIFPLSLELCCCGGTRCSLPAALRKLLPSSSSSQVHFLNFPLRNVMRGAPGERTDGPGPSPPSAPPALEPWPTKINDKKHHQGGTAVVRGGIAHPAATRRAWECLY